MAIPALAFSAELPYAHISALFAKLVLGHI